MIREFCQRAFGSARKFLRDQSGSIVIYTGAFMAVGMGGAALSIDVGRIVLLKTQLQNYADAAAMAGAAQLDSQSGALWRGTTVINKSMADYMASASVTGEIVEVVATNFYAPADDYITRGALTTDDVAARFVEVILQQQALSFFYAPALNVMTGKSASSIALIGARAVAMSDPFICATQPMMICNPIETVDNTDIPDNATYAGHSITLKPGTNTNSGSTPTWTPGNFGLLDLPEDAGWRDGATAVQRALEAEDPEGCYGYNVVTQPGAMTVSVQDGLNVRFGFDAPAVKIHPIRPAPNVIAYEKDNTWEVPDVLGNGDWPLSTYWAAKHPGVPLPTPLASATRYQVYLFEQGVPFYQKKGGGKTVRFVVNPDEIYTNGGNWELINPTDYPGGGDIPTNPDAPDDVWTDGEPPAGMQVADNGYERRILRVLVLNCQKYDVRGSDDYPSEGNYVEIFITEPADPPADGGGIYGEFIRKIDATLSLEFHGNVRLVE